MGYVYVLLIASLLIGSTLSAAATKNYVGAILISSTMISLSFPIIAISKIIYTAMLGMIMFEVFWGILTPSLTYWRNLLIPSEVRATMLSMIIGIGNIGSSIIVSILSELSNLKGLSFIYMLIIPILGMIAIILFIFSVNI